MLLDVLFSIHLSVMSMYIGTVSALKNIGRNIGGHNYVYLHFNANVTVVDADLGSEGIQRGIRGIQRGSGGIQRGSGRIQRGSGGDLYGGHRGPGAGRGIQMREGDPNRGQGYLDGVSGDLDGGEGVQMRVGEIQTGVSGKPDGVRGIQTGSVGSRLGQGDPDWVRGIQTGSGGIQTGSGGFGLVRGIQTVSGDLDWVMGDSD